MPPMKKRKADGAVVVNVDSSASRRTYKKKPYARRAASNWRKFSKLKPWSDFGAMRYPRGTPEGIGRFGETYALATPEQRAERANVGWYGNGLYTGEGSYNPAKRFREWATGAARNLGRGVGKQLNYNLNQQLASMSQPTIVGSGLYSGSGLYGSNSLIDSTDSRPSMMFSSPNDETQSLILTHKEYVGDVFGPSTTGFNVTSYQLQPGLSSVFPFLAQFAQNFDEYELHQMVWEFHSTVDANASTNASGNTGTIIMATNYKADAPSFTNKDEMIAYHGGVSGRLTESLVHGVECDRNKGASLGQKYIRTSPIANTDLKLYDTGSFQVAFQNTPSTFLNQQVGELWVYYTIKLSKPKLFAALGNGITQARFVSSVDGTETAMFNTLAKAQNNSLNVLVANSVAPASGNNAFVFASLAPAYDAVPTATATTAKGMSITFPAAVSGVFEIRVFLEGTATSLTGAGDVVHIGTGATRCNIVPWSDLYGAGAAGDAPAFVSQVRTGGTSPSSMTTVRIKIATSTNGIDNIIHVYPFGSSSSSVALVTTQVSLEIIEIGDLFATSSTLFKPRFVDYSTNLAITI